jgi:microcystin-dependent protein
MPRLIRPKLLPKVNIDTNIVTIAGIENAYVPSGVILMWSGSILTIPYSWALCDGNNGTPDLRDKFVISVGLTYNVASTGGSSTTTLAVANLPSHNHNANTNNTGSHTHNISGNSGSGGNHSHSLTIITGSGGDNDSTNYVQTLGTAADVISYSMGSSGNHTHSAGNYSASSAGSHSHSVTVGYTGSGNAFSIMPPYYSLAYIMKL